MASAYRSVAALLVSVFLLLVGNGLLTTIIPLGARQRGFEPLELGLIGSAYFTGMLIGAWVNPRMVRHSGHARAFTASIAIAVVATLMFPLVTQAWAWILFRGVLGFCFAGLYATVESWLQGKSDNATRGRVLAVYSVTQYAGWAAGNQVLRLDEPTSFTLFSLAAAMLAAAIVPLTVTTQDPPERPASTGLPIRWLLRTSPIGVVGTFLIGFANGPTWSLSQVFAASIGYEPANVGLFMTMLTLGSAALQIPIGKLSDRKDRRVVLLGLVLACLATEIVLASFGPKGGLGLLLVAFFVLGSVMSTQYYVLAAHVNDRTGRENAVGVAAVLLFVYCIGGIIGPITAAEAMAKAGPGALYWHNVTVHIVLAGYILWRMVGKPAPAVKAATPEVRTAN